MSDQSRPPPATGYPVPPNGHPPPPPSGISYPYQAPPPQTTNPYYYNNQNQPFYSNPRSLFLRRFFTSLALVFIVFFIIFFICWLVIRPRHPHFQLTSLSVQNLTLSTSYNRVSGTFNSHLLVYNPNKKMEILYDYVVSSVLYKSETLGEVRLPPFDQRKKNQTVVDAAWNVENAYVDNRVASGMNNDVLKGLVAFNVKVEATVEFKIGKLRARRRFLRVLCDDVAVKINNRGDGSLSGGSKECKVFI